MPIGLMVGPERGRYREKVAKLVADAEAAEAAGFASVWVPQIPDEFDALTAIALMGRATSRVELGTAVVPIQTRHPIAMAQQALAVQAVCEGRLTLGLGPSHYWIVEDMLGLAYEHPARLMRDYLEVLAVALAGPGPVDVENDTYRIHNPLDVTDLAPTPVLLAALAPVMLRLAGEHASGTILWMADERAIGDHIVPRLTKAAEEAGRARPRVVAGIPVVLCADHEVDAARARANQLLGHAEYSPNYERLLEHGDARDVGDLLAAGDEATIRARLLRFR
ncbi:MAG TPA: TIGR03564 family F420-dependent LLM class oxidoreductase, partial [Acidimicrobiia bacterium]|nr:TIGR03564 family F420-dependent LLM class oxidoreductase [Acidimicrobiia bacterium]